VHEYSRDRAHIGTSVVSQLPQHKRTAGPYCVARSPRKEVWYKEGLLACLVGGADRGAAICSRHGIVFFDRLAKYRSRQRCFVLGRDILARRVNGI